MTEEFIILGDPTPAKKRYYVGDAKYRLELGGTTSNLCAYSYVPEKSHQDNLTTARILWRDDRYERFAQNYNQVRLVKERTYTNRANAKTTHTETTVVAHWPITTFTTDGNN